MRIRVIDLETTGFEPEEHRICEIGYCDVDSTEVQESFLEGVRQSRPGGWIVRDPVSLLVNPGRTIPPETSAIHHIIDQDVFNAPPWDETLRDVVDPYRREVDEPEVDIFAAHSAKFERAFIRDELTGGKAWICTYKCALRLWPDETGHSNQHLRYSRNPVGLDREKALVAHRAGPDAYVTAFHLRDMLALAPIADLIKWSNEPALLITCHLKKHRGTPLSEVPSDYLRWVLTTDMDEDIKHTCQHHLQLRADKRDRELEEYARNGH